MKKFSSIILFFITCVIMTMGCDKPAEPPAEKTSSQKSIEELITDASKKQSELQGSLTKTEELLLKRTAERDSKRAEFMQIIRGRDKSAEEIVAEFPKEKSELESLPWFGKARSVWKDWKDIQRDVVIFTRQKDRLNKTLEELKSSQSKLERIRENIKVYQPGDPKLDKLVATIQVSVEEVDKAVKSDPTLDIVTEQDMTDFVKTKVSSIPGFELKSIDDLPSIPDFASLVSVPNNATQKSLYNGRKNRCAKIIKEAKDKAEKKLKENLAEETVEVWLETLDILDKVIVSWEDGNKFTIKYIEALEECKIETLLKLCQPYFQILEDGIATLENGENPQWETIVDAIEGAIRTCPDIINISDTFDLKLNIIDKHLNVLVKQNDWEAKIIQQRLEKIDRKKIFRQAGTRLVKKINGIEFVFRWCPAGTFIMGSPTSEACRYDDETQHEVVLTKGFWILETEVTISMFKAFVQDTNYESTGDIPYGLKTGWFGNNIKQDSIFSWYNTGFSLNDNHPVTCISWNDTQAFCVWLGEQLRHNVYLPTEAQWEYACRAGSTGLFAGDMEEIAWFEYNTDMDDGTHLVRTKRSNAWGLFDMHGNVAEWCEDWYNDYPSNSVVTDPVGPSDGIYRIYRGGGCISRPPDCRSACRYKSLPTVRHCFIGFRVVLNGQ